MTEMSVPGLCFLSLQMPQAEPTVPAAEQPFLQHSSSPSPCSSRVTDSQRQKSSKPRERWEPQPPKDKPYYVHEGEDVVLDVLLPMEAYDRVVHRQQDLDVVVILPGMAPLALHVPQPLRHQLQGVGEIAYLHAGH